MPQTWPARYLDGVTAHVEAVTVTPAAHGIEIRRADGGATVWRYAEIRQTQGNYAGEPARLERGTNPVEALVVTDPAFLSRLRQVAPRTTRHFHDPQTRARRPFWIAIALVAVAGLSIGIYVWGIPAVATFAAERVPVSWEEKLGESVAGGLVSSKTVCHSREIDRSVQGIVARLAAAVPDNPYTFRVTLVRNPMVNAFAAPGGHIVVYSGLLEKTDRPEELAGVLAHEMSHVLKRHGTKSIFRDLSTSIFLSILVGDANGAMRTVFDSAQTLGGLHYNRKAEEEADTEGLRMLQSARIDPSGMTSMFEKLEQAFGRQPEFTQYISTHPRTADRIAKLRAAKRAPKEYVLLAGSATWKRLNRSCRPGPES